MSSTMHTIPFSSQSTQTAQSKLTDTSCQVTLPSSAYDVQTQFGVLHSMEGTQTVDFGPSIETKEMTVVHEKEPTLLKGKKLQVRCDLTDSEVQTEEMVPTVHPTMSSTMHTIPFSSQSTQTAQSKLTDTSCQVTLPSSAYDVQTQFGVLHSMEGTQTVDFGPSIETKEMTVVHEKEPTLLKGKKLQVRCDLTDSEVQTEEMVPTVHPTMSSTMHTIPFSSQSTQTAQSKLTDTSCQVTLPSSAYDVQTQFGVLHSMEGTQTVDFGPSIETKEMTVVHEKEPTLLKGKKLQVRCDLTDSEVQTDQTGQIMLHETKPIQTILAPHIDASCQYTMIVEPISTSYTITSQAVSLQTDLPLFHIQRPDQRNKKFQVNLISSSSPRPFATNMISSETQTVTHEYQDVGMKQVDKTATSPSVHPYMIHSSISNIENTSQIIPKIKIDQECQVKITAQQFEKKLQYGSSFSTLKEISCQTVADEKPYHHDYPLIYLQALQFK
ncbi:unnamed protein product [Heterobilharzia americana]|nr:unnamed protein product [Heterobilharzia americana]